jgi:hypothetical protein
VVALALLLQLHWHWGVLRLIGLAVAAGVLLQMLGPLVR